MTKYLPLFWKIFFSLLAIFVITAGASLLSDWLDDEGFRLASIGVNFAIPVLIFFLTRFFNKKYNQHNPSDYGFNGNRFFRNFIIGTTTAILIIGSVISISLLFGISIQFNGLQENTIIQLLQIFSLNLMFGAWEEMYFRGLVFNTLKAKLSFQISAFITALLFTMLHAGTYDMSKTTSYWFVEVMLLAYVLLYLYVNIGSIWTAIAFHFMWDLLWSLIDGTENMIGFLQFSHYTDYAILLDNISIFALTATLVLLVAINSRYKKGAIKNQL